MSRMYCHKHDRHVDTDYDVECPECEDELEEDDLVEVAPGIYQTKADVAANMAYDEARDNEL